MNKKKTKNSCSPGESCLDADEPSRPGACARSVEVVLRFFCRKRRF